jgi:hypothetical protein
MLIATSATQAATLVLTDSGTIGGFTMTNEGISGGTATILITNIPNAQSFVNNVNGVTVPQEPISVNGPVTLLVTSTGGGNYNLALSPAEYTKTIGSGTATAQLTFTQTTGVAPTALPNFFNSSGLVTSVVSNANPTYDFSNFANGKGEMNFTFTATSFTGGATSFQSLFAKKGATATGTGAFSQLSTAVIPEPASMALLGIGMSGLFALRRFFKRPSVV